MKIAMIGQKRIPSREGGVEIVVEELSKRMVECGHEVTCYNRTGHHISGEEFDVKFNDNKYNGIRLKKVLTVNSKGLAAMTSSLSASLCVLFGDYDIVHYHAEGPCAMMWLPKLFGKKCVATIHGLDHQRAKWGKFAQKYILFGEKMAVKYADEIIVLSKGVQSYFKEKYNRNTVFISNGVNEPQVLSEEEILKRWGLKKNSYVLFLGRIVPEKGIHYLINAFEKVNTQKKLVIAGGHSDSKEYFNSIRELAKKDDRIIFTGFVQGDELQELYSNSYIYCLPSDLEGMPISLLEAMSYGNCCLVSNIDEMIEVIEGEQYGVCFEKSNVDDLANKLNCLLSDDSIVKKYRERAKDYILKKYSWDEVTKQTISLYMQVKNNED